MDPLRMTFVSIIGAAAVTSAALLAPAMAANSGVPKTCKSFTDSHKPGKTIREQLGTKGGMTCAQGKAAARAYFAGTALPPGIVVATHSATTVSFDRRGASAKAREMYQACIHTACITW